MTIAVDWDVKQQTNQIQTRYSDKGFESSYMKSIMQSFSRQRLTFQKSDARLHISLQEFKHQQWYMTTASLAFTKQDFSFVLYTSAQSKRFTLYLSNAYNPEESVMIFGIFE